MKKIFRLSAFVVLAVFSFTSLAWAGPAVHRNGPPTSPRIAPAHDLAARPTSFRHSPDARQQKFHYKPGVHHQKPHHNSNIYHYKVHHKSNIHRHKIVHKHHHRHFRHDGWKHDRHWRHRFHDWPWFAAFGLLAAEAFYIGEKIGDDAVYVRFEAQDSRYFAAIEAKYGNYNYRERVIGCGGEGWRYFWFTDQNVICVFVRDDGYTHTYLWNRGEVEAQAVALGLATEGQLAAYASYGADMPADMAADYAAAVLWPQTEWK